ncbi:MAG: YajQ family cyclic di-GMP-binding protein [Nocardioides sp.]|nr:YajQ family cyclic di-GMP-binding protein [Nocardioides sp.]
MGRSGNLPGVTHGGRLVPRQREETIAQPPGATSIPRAPTGRGPSADQQRTPRPGDIVADSSFDIVSKLDRQEVDNALGQAAREVATRFDFKGTGATIEWKGEKAIEITASADDRATAVLDVFKDKLVKRGVSLKVLDASEVRQSGQQSKIDIALKEGITTEDAKKIGKLIRDEGPKGVKAQVQGDELRVSSKKRDDLQAVQRLVKEQDYDFAVQFTNYR